MLNVEVAYAKFDQQLIVEIQILPGTTLESAIRQSGILALFPEINLETASFGVFSMPKDRSFVVNSGDRIEIYRSLLIDPKEARRIKANS